MMSSQGKGWGFYLAAGFLILLVFSAFLAPLLAPYDPQREHRRLPFHPPTPIHFCDEAGECSWRPFVYRMEMRFDENYQRVYKEVKTRKYFLRLGPPREGKLISVDEPAKIFLLGSDSRGRDLFSRVLYGGRISLSIGFLGAGIAAVFGLWVGCLAGYFGGRLDSVLMRTAEFFIMIPGFYFLLALRSALPPEIGSGMIYALTIVVLSMIGWGGVARVIRGLVLSIRQSEFVAAARVLGRPHRSVIFDHVVPHTLSYLFVILSISIPSYILMESALSLLGLGIQEPQVSWGSLLSEAVSIAHLQFYPWILFPGLFLFLTAWSFNVIGDGLRQGDL